MPFVRDAISYEQGPPALKFLAMRKALLSYGTESTTLSAFSNGQIIYTIDCTNKSHWLDYKESFHVRIHSKWHQLSFAWELRKSKKRRCVSCGVCDWSLPRGVQCSLQSRHNEPYGVSNHQHLGCFVNCFFWRTSKKTPKLRVTGLCEGNPPMTSS